MEHLMTWADYHAAAAEFNRLWDTSVSRQQPKRMRAMLAAMAAFEQAAQATSQTQCDDAIAAAKRARCKR